MMFKIPDQTRRERENDDDLFALDHALHENKESVCSCYLARELSDRERELARVLKVPHPMMSF